MRGRRKPTVREVVGVALAFAGVWLLVIAGVGGTFVAFWLYRAGVVRIGSRRATMFGTIEPVAATVTAVMWTGAIFTPIDLIGFALILIMAFLVH